MYVRGRPGVSGAWLPNRAGRAGESDCTISQIVGRRNANEPGTHMSTPAMA